jgi:hypothetical protein
MLIGMAYVSSRELFTHFIELFDTIIRLEKSVVLDRLFQSGYPAFILTVLSQLHNDIPSLTSILWQVGLLCSEQNPKFVQCFIELGLIEKMFDLKMQMGDTRWYDNYCELTGMFCYVFSQLTWEFDYAMSQIDETTGEHNYYRRLKPCLPFLQDVLLLEI